MTNTSPPTDAIAPVVYECPVFCGCWWRDNRDGTMSLFDGQQKSCSVCEHLPLAKLLPVSLANHLFIDSRGDGVWLVCIDTVYKTEDAARKACRKWKALKQPAEPSGDEAALISACIAISTSAFTSGPVTHATIQQVFDKYGLNGRMFDSNGRVAKRLAPTPPTKAGDDWCYEHGHKEHKRGSPACQLATDKGEQ